MICLKQKDLSLAEVAQLVEHNLAKVGVADSSSVFRSWTFIRLEWWNGRHEGLKLPWPVMAVRVQVPLRVPICNELFEFLPSEHFPRCGFGCGGIFFAFSAHPRPENRRQPSRQHIDGRSVALGRTESTSTAVAWPSIERRADSVMFCYKRRYPSHFGYLSGI